MFTFVENQNNQTTFARERIFKEILEGLRSRETVVFCGAGISVNSGLPTANGLVGYILERLGIPDEERDVVLGSGLPFEAFMETLHDSTDASQLFDIFDAGEPNAAHILLAKLAKVDCLKTICTTNFDRLIEKGLEREGLKRNVHYEVFDSEENFGKIDWSGEMVRIIKIHGSIEKKDEMAVTIKRIASREYSEQRQEVIKCLFSTGNHENVLVMGYSCSDLFDISPHIEAVEGDRKRVIYIEHKSGARSIKRENIKKKSLKNPFRKFEESKRVYADTDRLVEALWFSFAKKNDYEFRKYRTPWEKNVNGWLSKAENDHSKGISYHIPGNIFLKISEYKRAIKYHEKALEVFRDMRDKRWEAKCLGALGSDYNNLGEYPTAIKNYEGALWIVQDSGDKQGEETNLGNMGSVYYSLGEYGKAIEYHEQALRISRDIREKQGQAVHLGNLGLVHDRMGEYRKAIEYHERALQISREIGDKQGEGRDLGNLGIAYYSLGEYRKAIEYHEKALQISRDIGDKQGEGIHLNNLGLDNYRVNDSRQAIKHYERALQISRDIGDKQGEGIRLGNLGIVYYKLGAFSKATKYHRQAYLLARSIGDKKLQGSQLGNLGNAYYSLRGYPEAIKYYKQALRISRDIGDKQGEGIRLGNLGGVYHRLGEYRKAIKFYEDSVAILRQTLGDEHPSTKSVEGELTKTIKIVEGEVS